MNNRYFVSDYEQNLFSTRYRDCDADPMEMTWEDRIRNAVHGVTKDRQRRREYYHAFSHARMMMGSPQLWNFGSNKRFHLAGGSCYTLDIQDSLDSFIQAETDAVTVYSASGGAGFRFDGIRPRGCKIANTNSPGIGVLGHGGPLRVLEAKTGYITNGGRERGALMAQVGARHPDAVEFILAKVPIDIGGGEFMLPLQNCNMSIRIPDALMHAAEVDGPWVFSWFSEDRPHDGDDPWTNLNGDALDDPDLGYNTGLKVQYTDQGAFLFHDPDADYRYGVVLTTWEGLKRNLEPNPNNWKDLEYSTFWRRTLVPWLRPLHGPIMAREVLDLIYTAAHHCADPGIVFEDTYERWNPVPQMGERLSNPCSEFLNPPDGSCNLLSLNLRAITDDQLSAMARLACRWGNDALDHSVAPVKSVDAKSRSCYRTVGIGIMGLAEMLMMKRLTYGSNEAIYESARVMSEIALSAWEESFKLAEAGRRQPTAWNREAMGEIFEGRRRLAMKYGLPSDHVRRWNNLMARALLGDVACNTAVTSVAPTGSISMIVSWLMSRAAGSNIVVSSGIEPVFSFVTDRKDNSGKVEVVHDMAPDNGHHHPWLITAGEVSPERHVAMQAAIASFTCMSVSKTINLPNDARIRDVRQAYRAAWKLGVPGTTIFRDGSKPMQVLTAKECPSGECAIPLAEALADHTHDNIKIASDLNLL